MHQKSWSCIWLLHPDTKLNLRDGILGEGEKNSFIALPHKQGHNWLMPSKLCVSKNLQEGKVFLLKDMKDFFLNLRQFFNIS